MNNKNTHKPWQLYPVSRQSFSVEEMSFMSKCVPCREATTHGSKYGRCQRLELARDLYLWMVHDALTAHDLDHII